MPPKHIDLEMNWLKSGSEWRHRASYRQSQPYSARYNFRETVNGTVSSNDIIRNGVETWIDYIEGQILEHSTKSDGILDAFFKTPANPEERVNQLFDIGTTVAVMLINLDSQGSLEDLAKELIKCYQPKESSATEERDTICAQYLVLDCIGWISMCYIPSPDLTKEIFAIEIDAANQSISSRGASPVSKRPLGAVLRAFLPIQCRPEMPYKNELKNAGTILTVASLNYFSLHNIGKLSIDWTEKLSDHCLLDISRRQLKVFRFPAFCAQAYISQRGEQILTRYTLSLLNSQMAPATNGHSRISQAHICRQNCVAKMPDALHQYLYEVLLSYRLVFGENKRSRKLFRAEEGPRASRGQFYDPVLYILCGRKDISEIASLIPGFGDHGTFDTRTDFPELGERLRVLQEYIINQKPTTLRDIWNDHRDPHQTFAFWVVVIVGGTSIFLSFLQVVVSIAQLVVAVRQIQPL
jgi:hypothetical protein